MRVEAKTTRSPKYHGDVELRGISLVRHEGAPPSRMRYVIVAPHMSSRQEFGSQTNSLPNLLRALNERVFNVEDGPGLKPTPQPLKGKWQTLSGVSRSIAASVRKSAMVEPLTEREFLEQSPANKRALYAAAAEEYNRRGWSARDSKIKAFVKNEKINFTKKDDPCPRVIQPRTPVYNYALGRYTRRVEKELYSALAALWDCDEGDMVVMKGVDFKDCAAQLRRKWCTFTSPVAVGLDASRFDQHISFDALKWEHSVYNSIFRCSELRKLLNVQLKNKGFAFLDGYKLTYESVGTRASGDMNTSLGNCLIMCVLVRRFCEEVGLNAELANNGDDCMLFMERSQLHRLNGLKEWFMDFGINMKTEPPAYLFEQVEFCQTRPVCLDPVLDEWIMCRDPTTALAKDCLCLSGVTEKDYRQWCYQVGVGGEALHGMMPIFNELYSLLQREGVKSNVGRALHISDSGFVRAMHGSRYTAKYVRDVPGHVRLSFFHAFGIPPSMQERIESEYRRCTFKGIQPCLINTAEAFGTTT